MHRRWGVAVAAAACAGLMTSAAAQSGPSAGAKPTGSSWDAQFRELPQPSNIRATMERVSARPHHVGSAYDKENAEWIQSRFREWGWEAEIETFNVLFPTPMERVLELLEPTRFTAKLEEPVEPADPTSNQKSEQLPTFNAYSIDGDVSGPLVYVNYGRPEDYERRHRPGALRRIVARHQAKGRGRARRSRLPHLLGPEGRWVRGGRGISERTDASA